MLTMVKYFVENRKRKKHWVGCGERQTLSESAFVSSTKK